MTTVLSEIVQSGRFTFTLDQERVEVTTLGPSWRESWRAMDSNGHEHRYAPGFPTLRHVIDASHWCDGREGFALHDPHTQVDESHFECLLCDEVIEPASDEGGVRKWIPGQVTATLSGFMPDGSEVTAYLDDDEAERYRATPDDETAEAILLAVPDERIISRTFRG